MGFVIICFLRTYAAFDIVLSLFSAIGWHYYWKLSKYALFLQRYRTLSQSPEAMEAEYTNNNNVIIDQNLYAKQELIKQFCGQEPGMESTSTALIKFDDTKLAVLIPSVVLCCLAMFGFLMGGILLAIATFSKVGRGNSAKLLGICTLVAQFVSIVLLLAGSLLTLDYRLCALYVQNIRLLLLGSIFVALVLYKFHEVIMVIAFIRSQSRISQEADENFNADFHENSNNLAVISENH